MQSYMVYFAVKLHRQYKLQLGFVGIHQGSGCSCQNNTITLLALRGEDNFVAFLPHLCDQCLPWVQHASEPNFDVLVRAIRAKYMLAGDAHGAEAVQNWFIESANGSEFREDV